jgi:hypothetical protein
MTKGEKNLFKHVETSSKRNLLAEAWRSKCRQSLPEKSPRFALWSKFYKHFYLLSLGSWEHYPQISEQAEKSWYRQTL